jgi:hypothetical protein
VGCHLMICNLLFAEHTWLHYIVSSQMAHTCFPNSFHRPSSSLYSGGPNIKPWHWGRLSLLHFVLVFLWDNTYSKAEFVFTQSSLIMSPEHFSLARRLWEMIKHSSIFGNAPYRFDVSEEYCTSVSWTVQEEYHTLHSRKIFILENSTCLGLNNSSLG